MVQGLWAAPLEVRSYAVDLRSFADAHRESDNLETDYGNSEWLGALVKKAPFESRFLDGVTLMRDCSKSLGQVLGMKGYEGVAVYDLEKGKIVVKGDELVHFEIEELFRYTVITSLRTEISVYVVPGVLPGKRSLVWEGAPEGAELVTMLSCLHRPGQIFKARTGDGKLSIEGEVQIDVGLEYIDSRMSILADLPDGGFQLATGMSWLAGVAMVFELGSLDGEESIIAVVKQEMIMVDGSPKDEWILKEKGGAFLLEERLALFRKKDVDGDLHLGDEVRRFAIHPTFITFVSSSGGGDADDPDPDPFSADDGNQDKPRELPIYEGKDPVLIQLGVEGLYDIKTLLAECGVQFREGDFAVLKKRESTIYVKLSEVNLELLMGIIAGPADRRPRMIRVDLVEIQGGPESEADYWKKEGAKISRKMGQLMLPGHTATLKLGPDLAAEFEGYIDDNEEIVEVRVKLSESGGDLTKVSLGTGLTLVSGKPVLVQESEIGGKRKAWVATATIVSVEEELGR